MPRTLTNNGLIVSSNKLETTDLYVSQDANVAGTLRATTLIGDGSQLTGLTASGGDVTFGQVTACVVYSPMYTGDGSQLSGVLKNTTFLTDVTAPNVSVSGRLVMTATTTAGNSGVQFTSTGYQGPLVERRAAATTRLGLAASSTNDVAVYTNQAGKLIMGYPLSDSTFFEQMSVNNATGNVQIAGNAITNGQVSATRLFVTENAIVSGNITASGDITAFSDLALKHKLEVVTSALEKLARLTGYTYDRTDIPGRRFAGLVAQDVQEVLPEAVHCTNGMLHLAYNGLSALFVEGFKELDERLRILEGSPQKYV